MEEPPGNFILEKPHIPFFLTYIHFSGMVLLGPKSNTYTIQLTLISTLYM